MKKKKRAPGINSRNKGASAERELAIFLRERGYPEAIRGQQHAGGKDSPDVRAPGLTEQFHIECKRVEAGNLYNWLAQAQRDGVGRIPLVVHRRNKKEWVAILTFDDFLSLMLVRSP